MIDLGTDTDAVKIDYPDKAREVGEAIQRGDAERGVLVCGSGAGAAIAACKMTGIRAAICHDLYSAHQAVEHDDMNVLCLGSEIIGPSVARELVAIFVAAKLRRRRAVRRAPGESRSDGEGDEVMNERLAKACGCRASRSGSTCSRAISSLPATLRA